MLIKEVCKSGITGLYIDTSLYIWHIYLDILISDRGPNHLIRKKEIYLENQKFYIELSSIKKITKEEAIDIIDKFNLRNLIRGNTLWDYIVVILNHRNSILSNRDYK